MAAEVSHPLIDDADNSAPLAGLRALELTQHVAGPYCGRLLADYGAAVTKIEPPEGDPARHAPPEVELASSARQSLLYLYLNHGKQTIELDLESQAGRDRLLKLALEADVLIEDLRPGTLDRLGLGWSVLHAAAPRLILTSISNFGQTGPYRDYHASDIVFDALGGLSYIFGYPDREPLTHPSPQPQYRAGVYAAAATIAALLNLDDEGEWIDCSIMECVAAALRDTIPQYTYMGAVRRRGASPRGGFGAITPCADGYVIPTAYGAANWSTLARFLDAPEMDDPRFSSGEGRQRYADELTGMLEQRLLSWGKFDFFHGAQEWGIGSGIVLAPEEVLTSEQVAARGFLGELELEDGRRLPAPRRPFEL
jgi:crotonobetainyl-CoA:carnitine CoA-transferase CaiB-like acyl-CoA transferase